MPEPINPRRPVRLIPGSDNGAADGLTIAATVEDSQETGARKGHRLFRKYWWLGVTLALVGAAAGVVSVVLSSPIYKVRTLLEVQGINEAWLKNSFELSTSYDSNQINIQTQIKLLQQGPFLRRVNERLQAETVPPPPAHSDFFSKIRRRVRPEVQDPMQVMREGLQSAFESFDARPVNQTRLIELSCDSTNPQMASQFINTMASEFLEETMRARSQSSQKTNEWLTAQIEETKIKLQEAEVRLQDFVKRSGNLFVSEETTLDDSKLKQLRGELSAIQADRIGKQARYEMAAKSAPGNLPEALDDEDLRGFQRQVAELRREKASLETTLTPNHSKVKKIEAQLAAVQASVQAETESVVARLRNEYEAARRRESLLSSAYHAQLGQVSALAGKSAEHNSLRREVDTLRQMYQALLVQSNQTGLSGSVPVNPIRLVEPSLPPAEPYRPRPVLNISFGVIAGIFLAGGIVFLREKLDRSVKHPAATRRLLNVPQLGAIPSAKLLEDSGLLARFRRLGPDRKLNGAGALEPGLIPTAPAAWRNGPSFMAESFRATLASLMNTAGGGETPRMIAVTSPCPEDGKTTVACNLAMALAETGRKVLLIDGDFRRPHVHRVFGIANKRGLVDLLTDEAPLVADSIDDTTVATDVPGLTLLPNRAIPGSVSKALYSPRLRELLDGLRDRFDLVLIDTPPLLHLADTRLIAPWTDGIILVLRSGVTDRESALEACERIQADGLTLLGTVLNDWNPGKSQVKHYYDYQQEPRA